MQMTSHSTDSDKRRATLLSIKFKVALFIPQLFACAHAMHAVFSPRSPSAAPSSVFILKCTSSSPTKLFQVTTDCAVDRVPYATLCHTSSEEKTLYVTVASPPPPTLPPSRLLLVCRLVLVSCFKAGQMKLVSNHVCSIEDLQFFKTTLIRLLVYYGGTQRGKKKKIRPYLFFF